MKKVITRQLIKDIINKFLKGADVQISSGNDFFNIVGYPNDEEYIVTLGRCAYEGMLLSLDEFVRSNNSLDIDESIMMKYQDLNIRPMLEYVLNLDPNFQEALVDRIMKKVMENSLILMTYDVDNTESKKDEEEDSKDEFDHIIKIDPPKIVHEEELTIETPTLTDEERENLIIESEQLDKLEKYQGYLSIEEAFEEIKPGLTVYDYLEQNNVLSLIPLNGEILLDDGYVMSGITFIKERVIPGAKYYGQESVMETIAKYSTDYANKLEMANLKNTGIFK